MAAFGPTGGTHRDITSELVLSGPGPWIQTPNARAAPTAAPTTARSQSGNHSIGEEAVGEETVTVVEFATLTPTASVAVQVGTKAPAVAYAWVAEPPFSVYSVAPSPNDQPTVMVGVPPLTEQMKLTGSPVVTLAWLTIKEITGWGFTVTVIAISAWEPGWSVTRQVMLPCGDVAKAVAKLELPATNLEPPTDHSKANGDWPPDGVHVKRSDWLTSTTGREALIVTDRASSVPAVTVFELVVLEAGDPEPQPMQSVVLREKE
jgi:hypothetical protein